MRYLIQIHDITGIYFPKDSWYVDAAMIKVEFDDLDEATKIAHSRWRECVYGYSQGRSPFSYRVLDCQCNEVVGLWQQQYEYEPGIYRVKLPD